MVGRSDNKQEQESGEESGARSSMTTGSTSHRTTWELPGLLCSTKTLQLFTCIYVQVVVCCCIQHMPNLIYAVYKILE